MANTTIARKVADLIEAKEDSPLPLSVIPNHMGINLCSVDAISWTKQEDGQLVDLTIHFIPAEQAPTENDDPKPEYIVVPALETKDYCRACANGKCDEHPQYNACVACAIERKQRAAVAERKRSLDAALGRDEPVRVTIDICPVHSITTEETKDDCAGCVHRDEALRNATHRGDILHMALAAIFIESSTGSGLVEAAESRERMRAIAREAIEQ